MTQQARQHWVQTQLDRLEGPLLRYARRLLHGDLESARDVVQDAFLKLCRQPMDGLAGREREWLYTVVRNQAIDHLRKERRMQPTDQQALAQTQDRQRAPEADLQAADRKALIDQQLQTLSERDREVIRLKYQDGLSYAAIAGITGLSVSHVGVVLHHAIRRLRSGLAPHEGSLS